VVPLLDSLRLTAVARTEEGEVVAGRPVEWTSADPAVAVVNAEGTILPRAVGQTLVSALVDGVRADVAVRVITPVAVTLEIAPDPVQLTLADTLTLRATALRRDGTIASDRTVTWTSANPFLVSVDANGVLRTSQWSGQTYVRASVDAAMDSVRVDVSGVLPLEIWPDTNALLVGMSRNLTARSQDASGNVQSVAGVRWSSTDSSVARVDSTGRVTALGIGRALIVGTTAGRSSRAAVEVVRYEQPLKFVSVSSSRGLFELSAACGVTTDGSVYCWGENEFGTLGTTRSMDRCEIVSVGGRSVSRRRFRCSGIPVRVESAEKFVDVRVTPDDEGGGRACAWTAEGKTYCWGSNYQGNLGLGSAAYFSATPAPVAGTVAFTTVSPGCGITAGAELYCWGDNLNGAAGIGDAQLRAVSAPRQVAGDMHWTAVDRIGTRACAIATDAHAYCWGTNFDNQLGVVADGDSLRPGCAVACVTSPRRVATSVEFVDIASVNSSAYGCGLARDGVLHCWGLGATYGAPAIPVTPVATDVRIATLVGAGEACGLTAAGEGYCVTRSPAGTSPVQPFVLQRQLPGWTLRAADFGSYGCVIASDGVLSCYGYGALGDGSLVWTADGPIARVAGQ
jgi:uncharacterized protein YjdB